MNEAFPAWMYLYQILEAIDRAAVVGRHRIRFPLRDHTTLPHPDDETAEKIWVALRASGLTVETKRIAGEGKSGAFRVISWE